jgi:hypothetical protein
MTQKKTNNWVNVLTQVTRSINNSYNSSIGMAPSKVKEEHESKIWYRIYKAIIDMDEPKAKYAVGQLVRIGKTKISLGRKGFDPNWTDELFVVHSVLNTRPVVSYRLKDQKNENLQGTYLEPELNPVPPYLIPNNV